MALTVGARDTQDVSCVETITLQAGGDRVRVSAVGLAYVHVADKDA